MEEKGYTIILPVCLDIILSMIRHIIILLDLLKD